MLLYDSPMPPNPRKVRIYLAEKGLDIPRQTIDLMKGEQRSPEFRAKNPGGQLPVLELDDGTCIPESLAIIQYLEELHPTPPLMGTSPAERAQIRVLERIAELRVYIPTAMYVIHTAKMFATRLKQSADVAEYARANRKGGLDLLEAVLEGNDFLAGSDLTIADITLFIALEYGANRGDLPIGDEYPNILRWHQAFSARPSAAA